MKRNELVKGNIYTEKNTCRELRFEGVSNQLFEFTEVELVDFEDPIEKQTVYLTPREIENLF